MTDSIVRKPLPPDPPLPKISEMYEDINLLGNLKRLSEHHRIFKGWCYVLGEWCYYQTNLGGSTLRQPYNFIMWKFTLLRRLFSMVGEAQPPPETNEVFEWDDERYRNTGDYSGWCFAMGGWRYYVKEGDTHLVSPPSNNAVHRILGAILSWLPEPI